MFVIEDNFLLFLICAPGVYLPPGAGLGPGGGGTGTGFFPGKRASTQCLHNLKTKKHPERSHYKQSLLLFRKGMRGKLNYRGAEV